MVVLEDDEVHRRRSPPYSNSASVGSSMSMSPFPPAPSPFLQHYQPHPPSQDHEQLLPYGYRAPPASFDQYPGAEAQGGGPFAPPWLSWRQRGSKMKLLALVGGLSIIFLLHDHFFRRRREGGPRHGGLPPWFHHPPNSNDQQGPPPPPLPPFNNDGPQLFPTEPPLSTLTGATSPKESQLPPILDSALFAQPRRAIRPSWPDPWHDLPSSWGGREWLSPSRFPSDDPQQGLSDPPERLPPPASHLSRAMEFAVAAAEHLKRTGRVGGAAQRTQPLPEYEDRTGRPKLVKHEDVFITQGGWVPPRLKVSEIKGGGKMPRVQHEGPVDEKGGRVEEEAHRREWVKRAFLHAWEGYKKHAWGHDEVMPLSNLFSNNYNGWGATIVDNLDTLLLLNLSHEYNLARAHVASIDFTYLAPSGALTFSTKLPELEDLDLPPKGEALEPLPGAGRFVNPRLAQAMNQHSPAQVTPVADLLSRANFGLPRRSTIPHFETTIRYLGGLISAYDLSGDPLMLQRATELGDWLLPSLGTKFGLSINRYVLGSNPAGINVGRATLSEVGSLTMEFTKLSMITGNEIYYQAVQRSMDTLDRVFPDADPPRNGPNRGRLGTLLPSMVDPSRPDLMGGEYTFGGLADSYYEYLIKQAQLTSDELPQYSRMYSEAIDSAYEYLIAEVEVVPGRNDLFTIGSSAWGAFKYSVEHLTCFAGGMLSLGSRLLGREHDLTTGMAVTEACAWAYESSLTGLGPESLELYHPDDASRYVTIDTPEGPARKPRGAPIPGVKQSNPRFIGRPETIESIFYQWRLTGDRKWQDRGWQMFTSWMEHSITESGFSSLNNVYLASPKREDSQESFVLAETLKYYFLLFSPRDFISLDYYVFNTEAHPFRIPKAASSSAPLLWSGPDSSSPPIADFQSAIGEGTWVQKWARVQQAAGLLHPGKAAGGAQAPEQRPPAVRPPVRPKDEELKAAAAAAGHAAKPARKPEEVESLGAIEEKKTTEQKQRARLAMGGGRGMGGGAPPVRGN